MTDILVRVPAREAEHFWEEPEGGSEGVVEWWTLGTVPTQFQAGDRIYFALGSEVVAYAERSTELRTGSLASDDGRRWEARGSGRHVYWEARDFVKLDPPIPLATIGLQVPRGFGYCGHTQLRTIIAGRGSP